MVKALLDAKADVNLCCEVESAQEPVPPLYLANSGAIARALIDAGANVNFMTASGSTILGIQLKNGSYEDSEYVLEMLRAGAAVAYHSELTSADPKTLIENFLRKNSNVDKQEVRDLFKKNQA